MHSTCEHLHVRLLALLPLLVELERSNWRCIGGMRRCRLCLRQPELRHRARRDRSRSHLLEPLSSWGDERLQLLMHGAPHHGAVLGQCGHQRLPQAPRMHCQRCLCCAAQLSDERLYRSTGSAQRRALTRRLCESRT